MAGVTSLCSAAVSSVFSQFYVSFKFLQLSTEARWRKALAFPTFLFSLKNIQEKKTKLQYLCELVEA